MHIIHITHNDNIMRCIIIDNMVDKWQLSTDRAMRQARAGWMTRITDEPRH